MKHTDDFWTEHTRLFDGTFAYFDRSGQQKTPVWGKLHVSEEHYFDATHELVPLSVTRGKRVYVMLHPYVLQPKLIMTVGLYKEPKQYADQDSAIGETIGARRSDPPRPRSWSARGGQGAHRLPAGEILRVGSAAGD